MRTSTFTLPLVLAAALATQAAAQQTGSFALLCNGRTDYVASNRLLEVTNDFVMEAWVNPTAAHEIDPETSSGTAGCTGERYAIYPLHGTACWGSGHAGAGISVGINGVSVYEHAGDYMPATLVYEGAISGWTRVTVVYRGGVPSLYLNGAFVKRGIRGSQKFVHPSAGLQADGRWIYGGIGGGPWGFFAGTIDDVSFYGRAQHAADLTPSSSELRLEGRELLARFDMNRSGAGSGLTVASAAPTPSIEAKTVGTDATPVFTPRAEIVTVEDASAPTLR